DRFGNHTLRIGEYNGLSIGGDFAHAVWTGNKATPATQVTFYDRFFVPPASAAPEITFVTSRQALRADDLVDWNVLGSEGAHLATPQAVITNGGVGVTLSTSTGD